LSLARKIGEICVAKLIGSPPLSMSGTSTGKIKSYLQPERNSENKTRIRKMLRLFIIYIFKFNIKSFSSEKEKL
jgi:hypothetical protein